MMLWKERKMSANVVVEELPLPHRVGRVLSFFPVVGIGTPPTPNPQGSVPPPPSRFCGGEGRTRWRERGWESPNSDEGTDTMVLFIYTYFVLYCTMSYFPLSIPILMAGCYWSEYFSPPCIGNPCT
jgi:hypothetical protein